MQFRRVRVLIFLISSFELTAGVLASRALASALTWEECVQQTETQNPDLRSALESFKSADLQVTVAWSAFSPQVSAQAGTSYQPPALGFPESTYDTLSLNATQSIFNGFADKARIDSNVAAREVARTTLEITRSRVSYDLKSAFESLRYALDNVRLTEDITKRREESYKLVQLRFESGRENKGSALLSKANLAQAKFDALQARDSVLVARAQLAHVLDRDPTSEFEITGTIPVSEPDARALQGDLPKIALQTPTYRQAVAQYDSADAGVLSAESAFMPTLSATAGFGEQGTAWSTLNAQWSFGLTMNWSVFSGGHDYFNTKSALAQRSAAALSQQSTNQQLIITLQQNLTAFVEAVENLKVSESFLEAETVRAEISRAQYNNGLLSFEDWDIIENDLITRQKNELQSRRDRVISEAAWEQAQGKGVLK